MGQIAVGGVDFDHIVLSIRSALGRAKRLRDRSDLLDRQRYRYRVSLGERLVRRRHRLPVAICRRHLRRLSLAHLPGTPHARLAAGVCQLDTGSGALFVQEAIDPLQRRDLLRLPDAKILRTDPATARLPRWTKCQSFAKPSSQLYWHIGETAIRLRSVTSRKVSGEKRCAIVWGFAYASEICGSRCARMCAASATLNRQTATAQTPFQPNRLQPNVLR